MQKKRRSIITAATVLYLTVAPFASWSKGGIPPSVARHVRDAVFEVVVNKGEEWPIEYERDLPLYLLPFHIRNDEFTSIGTAFSVEPGVFVTAAHVFALEHPTLRSGLHLRSPAGEVFPIGEILRYDNHRDCTVFRILLRGRRVLPSCAVPVRGRRACSFRNPPPWECMAGHSFCVRRGTRLGAARDTPSRGDFVTAFGIRRICISRRTIRSHENRTLANPAQSSDFATESRDRVPGSRLWRICFAYTKPISTRSPPRRMVRGSVRRVPRRGPYLCFESGSCGASPVDGIRGQK